MAEAQLVIVGIGNMGEALLCGALAAGIVAREHILAVEPRDDRREQIAARFGVAVAADIADTPAAATYIIAVKPNQMDTALASVAAVLPTATALVISTAAGISTTVLAAGLGERARVIRAMPNTPMLVGCGCTGLCRGPGATEEDVAFARRLFAASGEAVVVEEAAMDAVTAVSGSGPAYFFYLVEAMTAAGAAEGLDPVTALTLARRTCAGAAQLLIETGEDPAALRGKVTSPGGTTQAAIEHMEVSGVKAALTAAVRAAAARSRELGQSPTA